jgi:transposase
MTHPLLPDLAGFTIEQITLVDGGIPVRARSQATSGLCPDCGHLSSRIHSRSQRKLADLPWSGRSVRLVMQVRRFFCTQPTCLRKTFTEAIPAMAERYARRTNRLKAVLERAFPRAWRRASFASGGSLGNGL